MKFLQKATLAAAIAAAPFAAQSLEALDDATLAATTGQAGVSIDVTLGTTGVEIGSITYTDTPTLDGSNVSVNDIDTTGDGTVDAKSGGSVVMRDLSVAGIDKTDFDDDGTKTAAALTIGQTIDVAENGDLVLGMSTPTDVYMSLGLGAVELQDNTAASTNKNSELVNSMSAVLQLGANSKTIVRNVDVENQTLADFGVTGTDFAAMKSGLVIEADMKVRVVDLDVELFGYTESQADALYGDGNGTIEAGETNAAAAAAGAAVKVKDLTFDDGAGGLVDVSQTIWAQGGTAAQGGGVYIQMGNIQGDLTVGAIEIGGASIGSVAVSNINLAGMTQRIYGH